MVTEISTREPRGGRRAGEWSPTPGDAIFDGAILARDGVARTYPAGPSGGVQFHIGAPIQLAVSGLRGEFGGAVEHRAAQHFTRAVVQTLGVAARRLEGVDPRLLRRRRRRGQGSECGPESDEQ